MDKTIIGIDFSPSSPGFCILKNDSCDLINIIRTPNNNISKMYNKEGSAIKILRDLKLASIHIIPKKSFGGEYHIKEREKILDAIYFSDFILGLLEPYLNENTFISMEGLSFASSGNALIDISMVTALIRGGIIKKINPQNFFVFSPMTIKKFAIKGDAKKNLLYLAFIEKKKEDPRFKDLIQVLAENKDRWIKGPKKIEIPCSDIIDSIWLSLFLEENLRNFLP